MILDVVGLQRCCRQLKALLCYMREVRLLLRSQRRVQMWVGGSIGDIQGCPCRPWCRRRGRLLPMMAFLLLLLALKLALATVVEAWVPCSRVMMLTDLLDPWLGVCSLYCVCCWKSVRIAWLELLKVRYVVERLKLLVLGCRVLACLCGFLLPPIGIRGLWECGWRVCCWGERGGRVCVLLFMFLNWLMAGSVLMSWSEARFRCLMSVLFP